MKSNGMRKKINSGLFRCTYYGNFIYSARFPLTRDVFPKSSIVDAFFLISRHIILNRTRL